MSLYVKESDFKGQTDTAKDIFSKSDLQEYIDKFEVRYLQDLLGCELYEEFATDFAITGTSPTDPKFIQIWNSFCKDNSCGIERSEGIKEMLVMFINFEYKRDQPVKNNIGGNQINMQENSTSAASTASNMYTVYNQALESYNAIQWCICDNSNNYDWSAYNGQDKGIIGYF
jgi:hypothetical protein